MRPDDVLFASAPTPQGEKVVTIFEEKSKVDIYGSNEGWLGHSDQFYCKKYFKFCRAVSCIIIEEDLAEDNCYLQGQTLPVRTHDVLSEYL